MLTALGDEVTGSKDKLKGQAISSILSMFDDASAVPSSSTTKVGAEAQGAPKGVEAEGESESRPAGNSPDGQTDPNVVGESIPVSDPEAAHILSELRSDLNDKGFVSDAGRRSYIYESQVELALTNVAFELDAFVLRQTSDYGVDFILRKDSRAVLIEVKLTVREVFLFTNQMADHLKMVNAAYGEPPLLVIVNRPWNKRSHDRLTHAMNGVDLATVVFGGPQDIPKLKAVLETLLMG